MFFWNSLAFSMIEWILTIWSLVLLPFLNPAEDVEVPAHVLLKPGLGNAEHYFASVWDECNCAVVCTFFGTAFLLALEWKLTISSPVATAEFSKLAGILSAALSQHHLSVFEVGFRKHHYKQSYWRWWNSSWAVSNPVEQSLYPMIRKPSLEVSPSHYFFF